MFCPVCKSFISTLDDECRVCGKVLKTKIRSKNSKKDSKKSKNKNKKLSSEIFRNKCLGGKTRQYNDKRNFEFSVLGSYIIW